MKVNTVKKAINVFIPKTSAQRFIEKPEIISIFPEDFGKIKYVHNVLEYRQKQITPEEVLAMFSGGKIGPSHLKLEMRRIKTRLFLKGLRNPKYFKQWLHSVDLSSKVTQQDCKEIADFMNMHNGKYINTWRGYTLTDDIPNIEKLALFVRSLKRIEKLEFYKNLKESDWENCIDGIINKPKDVIHPLMEYKYDSRDINNSITNKKFTPKILDKINKIKNFLDGQHLKNDMRVYRGEGSFGVFESVVLDEKNHTTLRPILKKFTEEIEDGLRSDKEIDWFIKNRMLKKYVTQERFMSTAIEPSAIEKYAEKVFWDIKVPAKSKASMIESYNVERDSEAELLIQKMSQLLIKEARYDRPHKRWYLKAELKQD